MTDNSLGIAIVVSLAVLILAIVISVLVFLHYRDRNRRIVSQLNVDPSQVELAQNFKARPSRNQVQGILKVSSRNSAKDSEVESPKPSNHDMESPRATIEVQEQKSLEVTRRGLLKAGDRSPQKKNVSFKVRQPVEAPAVTMVQTTPDLPTLKVELVQEKPREVKQEEIQKLDKVLQGVKAIQRADSMRFGKRDPTQIITVDEPEQKAYEVETQGNSLALPKPKQKRLMRMKTTMSRDPNQQKGTFSNTKFKLPKGDGMKRLLTMAPTGLDGLSMGGESQKKPQQKKLAKKEVKKPQSSDSDSNSNTSSGSKKSSGSSSNSKDSFKNSSNGSKDDDLEAQAQFN